MRLPAISTIARLFSSCSQSSSALGILPHNCGEHIRSFYNLAMATENSEEKQSKPWLFKKGQSGNPAGRPKGSVGLKTWAKEYQAK
jgi:hypothetical protein